jgi:hypothetical protein
MTGRSAVTLLTIYYVERVEADVAGRVALRCNFIVASERPGSAPCRSFSFSHS